MNKQNLSRFVPILLSLLLFGLSLWAIAQELHIALATVTSAPVREPLSGMRVPMKSGSRLAQAMADTGQFEPLAVNLVRVGEETGKLGPMLLELAVLTDQRVETGLKRVLALLEPALIVVLGVLVAGIIVSILLGILSINDLAV